MHENPLCTTNSTSWFIWCATLKMVYLLFAILHRWNKHFVYGSIEKIFSLLKKTREIRIKFILFQTKIIHPIGPLRNKIGVYLLTINLFVFLLYFSNVTANDMKVRNGQEHNILIGRHENIKKNTQIHKSTRDFTLYKEIVARTWIQSLNR